MKKDPMSDVVGKPAVITIKRSSGEAFKLTGRPKATGDGTYYMESGFGASENPAHIERFTASEVASVNLL